MKRIVNTGQPGRPRSLNDKGYLFGSTVSYKRETSCKIINGHHDVKALSNNKIHHAWYQTVARVTSCHAKQVTTKSYLLLPKVSAGDWTDCLGLIVDLQPRSVEGRWLVKFVNLNCVI